MTDKQSDYSLSYYHGALQAAFRECADLEKSLGLNDGTHCGIYTRLEQFRMLLQVAEQLEDELRRREERIALLEQYAEELRGGYTEASFEDWLKEAASVE